MPCLKVFWVADNDESETRLSKFQVADPIWPSLYLKNVSIFIQTQWSDLKNLTLWFFETLITNLRPYCNKF